MSSPYFFTWQAQRDARPLTLRSSKGVWLDTDEGTLLDLGSLVWSVNAGHGHPKIIAEIQAQAARLCVGHPSADFPEKRALAEALLAKAPPGFTKVFFTLGGSDANENALKMARAVTGRYKAVARYRGYHGATFGASSLSGDWRRAAVEPGIPGVVHVLDLDEGWDGKSQIPRVLELEGGVAAVFLEPVVGANGVLIPPPDYFAEVRQACTRHGALLVIDEVLTGFGRTGRFFAHEHFAGADPDIITCGKAITSGYAPLGAVLVHERVADVFESKVLPAGLTHYAHPLSIAAALATQRVYEEERLVERAAERSSVLQAGFAQLVGEMPEVTDARVIGLLGALDLDFDAAHLSLLSERLRAHGVYAFVKGEGQLRRPGGALMVAPPLSISEDELREGLRRITEALRDVIGEGPTGELPILEED